MIRSVALRVSSLRVGLLILTLASLMLPIAAQAQATASFSNVIATLGGGFSSPHGVAVDGSGNVYVADYSNNAVYEMPANCASSSCVKTLGGGFYYPYDVAVDGSGNVYVADYSNSAVKEMPAGCASSSCVTALGGGFSHPSSVTVDGSGNVYVADYGNSAVYEMPAGCASSSCVTKLGGPYNNFLNPTGVAVDGSGNVYVADAGNNRVAEMSPGCSNPYCVTRLGGYGVLSSPSSVAVDGDGNVYVADAYIYAQAVFEISAGCQATSCVTKLAGGFNNPTGVAVDGSGNVYVADYRNHAVKEIMTRAVNFLTVPVGTTSAVVTLPITFTSAGKLSSSPPYFVLTEGAPDLDFKAAATQGANVCNGTTAYNAGDICTVNLTFTPTKPGLRYGKYEIRNAGQSIIVTGNIYGTGAGPQVVFSPATQSTLGGGFSYPVGAAVDGAGNVFVADYGNNAVKGTTLGCASASCMGTVGSGFSTPFGVALDGRSNVYVADYGNNAVKVMEAACHMLSCVTTVGGGFSKPGGVAVDGSGNIYVADSGNNAVKKMRFDCASSSCVTTLGGGFRSPFGVAVDANGNVYVADHGNNAVKEIPAGCTSSSCVTALGGGFNGPYGVAVDSSGNVYVADFSSTVQVMPAGCASSSCVTTLGSGFSGPYGVALDSSGNVYVSDTNNSAVKVINRAAPPSLSFATTAVGSTSNDSPQTVQVSNIGNQPLIFSTPGSGTNPSYPANFPVDTSDGNLCSFAAPLAEGSSCDVSVNFLPTSVGANTGSVVLTDNTLNQTNATQSISLSGTGMVATQTITFQPITGTYGTLTSFTLSATSDSGLTVAFASASTSVCTVSGTTVSLLIPGTCVIQATQPGNSTYAAAAMVTQSFSVSSLTQTITFPAIAGTHGALTSFTLSATSDSGLTVVFASASASVCTVSGTTVSLLTPGTCVIQATQPGNSIYPAAAMVTQSFTVSNAPQTIPVTIANAGTLGSIYVLTTGQPNLDFQAATGGTCVSGATYAANDTCTVAYTFQSQAPGLRMGAVQLVDSTGTIVLGTTLLTGTGTGPALVFPGNTTTTALGSGFSHVYGVAVDGAGNVYVADYFNNAVKEIIAVGGVTSSASTVKSLGSSFSYPRGVAVDGAGNVYVADQGNSAVKKIVAVGGITSSASTVITLGSGFAYPYGVAVDGAGNVFVADTTNSAVKEIVAVQGVTSSASTVKTLGSGFAYPEGVAVDGAGNVFVADAGNSAVKEIVAMGGVTSSTSTVNTLGSGFHSPTGVAVDGAGNVYVADYINSAVKEIVAMGGVTSSASTVITLGSGFAYPEGVAVDGAGNVFVADTGNSAMKEIHLATPPSLSFTSTNVGSPSADSPQTLLLQNIGNAPLLFPIPGTGTNPSISTNFLLGGASTCPQITSSNTTEGALAPGICTDLISFLPTTVGSINGALVLTDNQTNAVASIALSGNATLETPTITFAVSNRTYGDGPFTVAATSASTGAITYSVVSGPATISGSTVTLTGVGTVVLSASQAASGNYAATTATTSFTVAAAVPTLIFATIAAQTYGNAPFTVSATSASTGAITYAVVSGPATISSSTVTLTGIGAVTISASQAASGNYAAATATTSFTVAAAVPTLSFATIAAQTYGNAPFTVSATSASTGAITYSVVSGPATISGSTVTLTGVGTVVLRASQTANGNYAATTTTTSFTVNPNTPTLSWNAPSPITYGTALSATQLNARANVAGTFSYAPALGTVLTAGKQTLSVTFTPTDTTDYTTATTTVALTVNQSTPVITWATPAAISYGTTLGATQLNAISNTPGTILYSPAAGTVLRAGAQTLTATFTPTDTADYATATSTVVLTVSQAASTITWATPAAITYGTALSATQLNARSTVAGNIAYSPAAGTVLGAGTQPLKATFMPTDQTDYASATQTVQLTVNKATPAITWSGASSLLYGVSLASVLNTTAIANSSSVAGSFSYTATPASGSAGPVSSSTVLAAGSYTITASFTPTDSTDYTPATSTLTLTVSLPAPVIDSLSPGYTTATSAAFTLTLNGSGFVPTSTASWGTTALATQVVSSTQLTATVPATLIATAGQATIQVVNSSGSQTISSNTRQFEIDSASTKNTPPSFTSLTATVSAGSTASYLVTLPTTATGVTVTCLNLPVGATCSYSATTGAVTIATSSTTPSGTYQIVVIFNETLPGVAGSYLLFPLLLLPVAFARRKWLARNFWVALCAVVLMTGAATTVGCGGSSQAPSHQVTSSSSVTLIVR